MKISPVTAVFVIFIAANIIAMAVIPNDGYSEREKRYLASFPELSAEAVSSGDYQSELEEWFSDWFPLRDFWVGVNSYLMLLEGRNTQRDIYYCSDGYLINDPGDYDEERFVKTLTKFDSFAEETGLPAELIIAPSSGYINEDVLPAGHGEYRDDEFFSLAEDTLSYVKLFDARETLLDANGESNVFYRTDHHLTSYGTYAVYSAWRSSEGRDYTPREDYSISSYDGFYGTTWSGSGYWFTKPDALEIWDSGVSVTVTISDGPESDVITSDTMYFTEHFDELDYYPVFLDGNHQLTEIHNPSGSGSVLIIKDSYAHDFATFLANEYEYVYMADLRYYRGYLSQFIEENGVDEILFLYGIDNLLTDTNASWLM